MYELLVLAQLSAENFDLKIRAARIEHGSAKVLVTVANNASAHAERVFVECALLDKAGAPLEIARGIISHVAPGTSVHGMASNVSPGGAENVSCRVSQATAR